PFAKVRQQRAHLRLGAGLRVPEERVELGRGLFGEKLREVGIKIGHVDAARARRAQVDDAVHFERAAVVWQLPAFERLQEAADERRLASPAAPDDSRQAQGLVLEEAAEHPRLDVPILKVLGGESRRRVDELAALRARDRTLRLALAHKAARDALLDAAGRRLRVADDLL